MGGLPSRRSENASRARAHAKTTGASYAEPKETKIEFEHKRRRPFHGELAGLLERVPQRTRFVRPRE